jgi:hypothetical protein
LDPNRFCPASKKSAICRSFKSRRQDLNLRPPGPQATTIQTKTGRFGAVRCSSMRLVALGGSQFGPQIGPQRRDGRPQSREPQAFQPRRHALHTVTGDPADRPAHPPKLRSRPRARMLNKIPGRQPRLRRDENDVRHRRSAPSSRFGSPTSSRARSARRSATSCPSTARSAADWVWARPTRTTSSRRASWARCVPHCHPSRRHRGPQPRGHLSGR